MRKRSKNRAIFPRATKLHDARAVRRSHFANDVVVLSKRYDRASFSSLSFFAKIFNKKLQPKREKKENETGRKIKEEVPTARRVLARDDVSHESCLPGRGPLAASQV